IIDHKMAEDDFTALSGSLQQIIETQGGTIVKSEDMGIRRLAYEIDHRTEGHYLLLEIEGSGAEIAELERRMRVSDAVVRYITVRVDLDRRRADKFKDKRARRASKRTSNRGANRNQSQQPEFAIEEEVAEVE
ncbi:MAG TPA: 30S ribosomal protein S6, partial [Pyrinomonadaceae bacterium]|nr:30S ribosomal protein S6 [Pyrinomonadaceae bacterium]